MDPPSSASVEPHLFLIDHPVSDYAQKVRLALREKELPFTAETPATIGSGRPDGFFEKANPRMEVPVLIDHKAGLTIPDSTIILQYLEEAYPGERNLLAQDAISRARHRMIEKLCDTTYEATNWTYIEVVWGGRATGELADTILARIKTSTEEIQDWLEAQLRGREYFSGDGSAFGMTDIVVAPHVHKSCYFGYTLRQGSGLQRWHDRILQRSTVRQTFEEFERGADVLKSGAFREGYGPGSGNRRQYRDHRLEFMIKSGGIDVVTRGLKDDSIRFP